MGTGTPTQNRMTVSHLFFNKKTLDASVNLQAHERNQALPKPDEKIYIEYDPKDPGFLSLIQAVTLGTYTQFLYDPSEDECKQLHARMQKKPVAAFEGVTLEP